MGYFDFGWALSMLRAGKCLARKGWNGKGMYICMQRPDEHSKMQRPYIYISPVNGAFVPWCPSHGDLLGEDWEVVGA